MIRILFFLLMSPLLLCQDINSLVPENFLNYKKSGEAEIYKGSELYRLIDGGADIFFEYGFVQVIRQRYSDEYEQNTIDIEIYEMKDSAASFGIFSLFTNQTGEAIAGVAEAFGGDEYLLMRRGNYYISQTILGNTESPLPDLAVPAQIIEKKIQSRGIPQVISDLKNYTKGRIVYIKGSLGLYNLSPVNFGSRLSINEAVFYNEGKTKVFILFYNNPENLLEGFTSAINYFHMDKEFKVINSSLYEILFSGKTNVCIFTLDKNVVIAFSEDQDSMKKELDKLKSYLSEKKQINK